MLTYVVSLSCLRLAFFLPAIRLLDASQAKPTGSASPGCVRVRIHVRLLVRYPHFVVLFFTYWCDVGVRLAPCAFVLTRP